MWKLLQERAAQRYGSQPPPHEDYICICVNEDGKLIMPDTLSEQFQRDQEESFWANLIP